MPGTKKNHQDDTRDNGDEEESDDTPNKKKRRAAPGVRHRRDNGPAELNVEPAERPSLQELGTLTRYTTDIIAGGPRALVAAQHKAAKMAKKFGIEFEKEWFLRTPWLAQCLDESLPDEYVTGKSGVALLQMTQTQRARVCAKLRDEARYALHWRPRYLASFALSGSTIIGTRAARISVNTPRNHRNVDPDFDAQCLAAEEYAVQLLHDVAMRRAIEGDCEPIFWQGITVGYVRKYDGRLQIEMLRAKMPKVFKTPGAKVAINAGTINQNSFIFGPDETAELQHQRQSSLKRMAEQRSLPVPAEFVKIDSPVDN